MKKYISIVSVFIFVFILFGFNFNIAKAETTPAPNCVITSTLKVGSTGDEVACLQEHLGLFADGKFGKKTKAAVADWQYKKKLTVDGRVGRMSRNALENDSTDLEQNPAFPVPAPTNLPTPSPIGLDDSPVCTSGGFDSTTGAPLPCGCTTSAGFSSTTGESCTPKPICTNGFNPVTGFRCGCTSNLGWSTTTGESCGPTPTATSVTVLSPNGGETFNAGKTYSIKWSTNNLPVNSQINIVVQNEQTINYYIASNLVNRSSLDWTIPNNFAGGKYKAKIFCVQYSEVPCSGQDFSDGFFTIVATTTTNHDPAIISGPTLSAITKWTDISGGAVYGADLSFTSKDPDGDNLGWTIDWGDGSTLGNPCPLPNSEGSDKKIHQTWNNSGKYTITLTVDDCRGGKVVKTLDANIIPDLSQPIMVTSPREGEIWTKGTMQTIKWSGVGSSYDIYFGSASGDFQSIAKSVSGYSYNWTIPSSVIPNDYTIEVCKAGTNIYANILGNCGTTEGYFKIVSATTPTTTLTITTTSPLPNATVGTQYKAYIYTSNGFGSYVWSFMAGSGSMPPGIVFASSDDCGVANSGMSNVSNCTLLLGTPTTAGTYTFTLRAKDNAVGSSAVATKQFILTVNPTTTPTVGTLNVSLDSSTPAAQTITAGQGNVTFTKIKITAGSLNVNNLNAIQIASDSAITNDGMVNYYRIYDGNTLIGSTPYGLAYNGTYYYQWVYLNNKLSIPAGTSKILSIVADTSPNRNGNIRLGLAGWTFDSPGALVNPFGIAIYGNIFNITSSATTPSCTITATPSTITAGQKSRLNWDCKNVNSVKLTPGNIYGYPSTYDVYPTTTTYYTLNYQGTSGSGDAGVNVTVNPTTTPTVTPTIISLLPTGCTINTGYSSTTGTSCSVPRTSANDGDRVEVYGTNFSSIANVVGGSNTPGNSYFPYVTNIVSPTLLSFWLPANMGIGTHLISVRNSNDNTFVSNSVTLDFNTTTTPGTNTKISNTVCPIARPPLGYHYEGIQPYPVCGGYLVKDVGDVMGAESFHFTQTLKNGSKGNEVAELQKFLNKAGYYGGKFDGKFGKGTSAAVINWQKSLNLKADGSFGAMSRAALENDSANTDQNSSETSNITTPENNGTTTTAPINTGITTTPINSLMDGCTSNSGFSTTTGLACGPNPIPPPTPPAPVCTSGGFDPLTGAPLLCGCTTSLGFSTTTGLACGPNPIPPPAPVCTNGFNPVTGYRCGCTSNFGWSTTTGESCGATPPPPPAPVCTNGFNPVTGYRCGCTSNFGWSTTTGESCSVIEIPTPICPISGFDSTTGLRCGCASNSGFSTTTGLSCAI